MADEESSLRARYAMLSTEELTAMYAKKNEFTPAAQKIMAAELTRRHGSPAESGIDITETPKSTKLLKLLLWGSVLSSCDAQSYETRWQQTGRAEAFSAHIISNNDHCVI